MVGTEEEVFDEGPPEKETAEFSQGDTERGQHKQRNLEGTTAVATPVPAHVTNPTTPNPEMEEKGGA